jgi:hypothetical protein
MFVRSLRTAATVLPSCRVKGTFIGGPLKLRASIQGADVAVTVCRMRVIPPPKADFTTRGLSGSKSGLLRSIRSSRVLSDGGVWSAKRIATNPTPRQIPRTITAKKLLQQEQQKRACDRAEKIAQTAEKDHEQQQDWPVDAKGKSRLTSKSYSGWSCSTWPAAVACNCRRNHSSAVS